MMSRSTRIAAAAPSIRALPCPRAAFPLNPRAVPQMARARSSAGEHYVDIVGVTGSIPVAPTTLFDHLQHHYGHITPVKNADRILLGLPGLADHPERPFRDLTECWDRTTRRERD